MEWLTSENWYERPASPFKHSCNHQKNSKSSDDKDEESGSDTGKNIGHDSGSEHDSGSLDDDKDDENDEHDDHSMIVIVKSRFLSLFVRCEHIGDLPVPSRSVTRT